MFEKLIALALIAALVWLAWWYFFGKGKPGAVKISGAKWNRQTLTELSVETPVPLAPVMPKTDHLTPAQRRQIEAHQEWKGETQGGFLITSTYLKIDGTHTYSLEGGAQGEMRLIAALCGVSNPAIQKTDVGVDGLPARRLTYTHKRRHFDEVIVQDSRKIWIVMTCAETERQTADARRVLQSIRIQRN